MCRTYKESFKQKLSPKLDIHGKSNEKKFKKGKILKDCNGAKIKIGVPIPCMNKRDLTPVWWFT